MTHPPCPSGAPFCAACDRLDEVWSAPWGTCDFLDDADEDPTRGVRVLLRQGKGGALSCPRCGGARRVACVRSSLAAIRTGHASGLCRPCSVLRTAGPSCLCGEARPERFMPGSVSRCRNCTQLKYRNGLCPAGCGRPVRYVTGLVRSGTERPRVPCACGYAAPRTSTTSSSRTATSVPSCRS